MDREHIDTKKEKRFSIKRYNLNDVCITWRSTIFCCISLYMIGSENLGIIHYENKVQASKIIFLPKTNISERWLGLGSKPCQQAGRTKQTFKTNKNQPTNQPTEPQFRRGKGQSLGTSHLLFHVVFFITTILACFLEGPVRRPRAGN